MALEHISQAVLETARTNAEHIRTVARKAAEDSVRAGRHAAEQEGERRYQAATRAIEEEFARKVVQFKGACNKELLEKKNGCLRKIFESAREKLVSMPEEQYGAVMKRLLERAAAECGGVIRIHPTENELFIRILAQFNNNRSSDKQVRVDGEHPLSERGGFVFVSTLFEVDQTLRTLLTEAEHEMAPGIAADVFGA